MRGATSDDDAFVAQLDYFYWDPDDAVNELLEALSCTPGIEIEAELDEGVIPGEMSYTANGRSVTLEKIDRGDGEWEIFISVHNGDHASEITITCEFDASANPTEEPDLFPAWKVSTSRTSRFTAPGVWGVSQWLIEQVWESDQP